MVTFIDETTAGERGAAWHLEIFEERLTLREVIRRRVFQEVAEHNAAGAAPARSLVQRPAAGRGFRRLDAEEEFARAVEAFRRNGFVVLAGERQVDNLDDTIELSRGVEITFLKLIPLVGG